MIPSSAISAVAKSKESITLEMQTSPLENACNDIQLQRLPLQRLADGSSCQTAVPRLNRLYESLSLVSIICVLHMEKDHVEMCIIYYVVLCSSYMVKAHII